jgi:hypothetical protein
MAHSGRRIVKDDGFEPQTSELTIDPSLFVLKNNYLLLIFTDMLPL